MTNDTEHIETEQEIKNFFDSVLAMPLPLRVLEGRKRFQEITLAEVRAYERSHPTEPTTHGATDLER